IAGRDDRPPFVRFRLRAVPPARRRGLARATSLVRASESARCACHGSQEIRRKGEDTQEDRRKGGILVFLKSFFYSFCLPCFLSSGGLLGSVTGAARRLPPQVVILRLVRQEQAGERDQRRQGEVIADVPESVLLREPGRHVRRERRAEDAGEVERERAAGVADGSWKELGQLRAQRTVREADQRKSQRHRQQRAP